jgi:hypothetical protein
VNDSTPVEEKVRASLRDAADHASIATAIPLADLPTRQSPTRARRTRVLVAACAAAVAVAVVVAGVALARDDDASVHVSSDGPTGSDVPIADLDRTVEVFMLHTATDNQVAAVRAELDASPDVARYVSLDHDAAHHEFAEVFPCDPDLVSMIRPQNLPRSFRVVVTDPGGVDRLRTSLEVLPGVALVGQPRSEDYRCRAPATLPAAGDAPADPAAALDDVVASFTQAWEGTNSFDLRRAAMEDFPDTDRLVEEFDQARPGNGAAMRAVVGDIIFETPERAAVLFHLEFGSVAEPIDVGTAVLQDGTWKVDRETVCTMAQRVGVACAG